jgi:hypothetical protein
MPRTARDKGNEAATWHSLGLIQHWNRKHANAAYVPYRMRADPAQQYGYGDRVRLGIDTDLPRFLKAMAQAAVIYDPGIKLEAASTSHPILKRRSQFRIRSGELGALDASFDSQCLVEGVYS